MLFVARCPLCARPGPAPCKSCAGSFGGAPVALFVPGAASALARYPYDGDVRKVLLALKYANARASAAYFATELAGLLDGVSPALVTWVPTSPERRRERGFDQAEQIARRLGRRLGLPGRALLLRLPGPAQTGRSSAERRAGPAFRPLAPAPRGPVVLVDDVATTLATVTSAVAALAGAAVHVRTVAATPRRDRQPVRVRRAEAFGPCLL